MDKLLFTKMIFFYEKTVGIFKSENIDDLFEYYNIIAEENPSFEKWIEQENLEEEWKNFSS